MVFSIPSYLCTADPPKRVVDERARGATFLVPGPKTGHAPDALFDKHFRYVWNGERSVDAATRARREQLASRKHDLTPNGFVWPGPPQRPEGLGSYYGCFAHAAPAFIAEHAATPGAAPTRTPLPPRGIYTSPGRKGTGYGYANLALSALGSDYMHSEYDAARVRAREERAAQRRALPAEPFRPVGRRGFTFDESPATGASRCYMMTAPFRAKKQAIGASSSSAAAAPHGASNGGGSGGMPAWRPPGYVDGRTTDVLTYYGDPYDGDDPREGPKARRQRLAAAAARNGAAFRPSSCSDTFWYTQSIVFKRV